ncbi:hypothetical protein GCM10008025_30930 [Ornithinibacillus halotolerans]|uniref:DUF3231 family protein n=2 Tax=Ornithinibacillus halotolerans TaxID=1274357 RepID=A0A916S6V1_9BACI|nr:hypothetical protein GCM10008025_30930 [Ornithinibacillus halotolerans]
MSRSIMLTSGEIASLWTSYMNDTMSKQILGYMLKYVTDSDIKPVVQYAYDLTINHIKELEELFNKENFAIPNGFDDQDVNPHAPWLYTDVFCLTYVNHMARVGGVAYGGFLSMSIREDIRDYFSQANKETTALYNRTTEIALAKGVSSRHPYISVPKETDYIDSKKYLSGLNPFSEKRPLNAIEIAYLYMNIVTNSLGVKLCISFAQTSQNKEVQEYMLRGKEIANKHIKLFADTLMKDDIEATKLPDISVSDSTTWTFSDKMMMFHIALLMQAGIGNYATAAAASQRSDLMINYERFSLEVAAYAKSGADIMIKHNWLEQPPGVKDRNKLAREKK